MFGKRKRTYRELHIAILRALKKDNCTIYEIAKKASLHFQVVQRQLISLKGQDFVSMDFVYKNFRLFSITDKGVKYLRKITR